jgi:enoyl-CoA hydratase
MPDLVLTHEAHGVLTITLNRPELRNAVNLATTRAVAAILERFETDAKLRVAILTGAGGHFCSGMDLKAFAAGEPAPRVEPRGFLGLNDYLYDKPIIAAVEGFAVAGGLETVLSCDIVVASQTARFGIPETQRGLIAAGGGLTKLPRRIPMNVALEMALTGEPIDASRAAQLGLVNLVTEPGQALEEAQRIATRIAANAPLSVAASKKVILAQQDWSLEECIGKQRAITDPIGKSADAQEGARAFAEKRDPHWQNK